MRLPSFLYPPKIMLLQQIRQQGAEQTLHHIWQSCGYSPACYRLYPLSPDNSTLLWFNLVFQVLIILGYTLPLLWLYSAFDLFDFSRGDFFIWGSWLIITALLLYRRIPFYCDLFYRQKIVMKAVYTGYKYIGGINKFDFKTLVFETTSRKTIEIRPFWPREQEIIAKFLGDAEVGHPVYIEKAAFSGWLLNLQSDWKALGQET